MPGISDSTLFLNCVNFGAKPIRAKSSATYGRGNSSRTSSPSRNSAPTKNRMISTFIGVKLSPNIR